MLTEGGHMHLLLLFLLLLSCERLKPVNLAVGDCVIGEGMDIWKLIRADQGEYLFVTNPVQEGSRVELMDDVSTFKKVECPVK